MFMEIKNGSNNIILLPALAFESKTRAWNGAQHKRVSVVVIKLFERTLWSG